MLIVSRGPASILVDVSPAKAKFAFVKLRQLGETRGKRRHRIKPMRGARRIIDRRTPGAAWGYIG